MKLKQISKLLIVPLLPVAMLAMPMLFPSTANALTNQEIKACADKWGGRSTDPKDSQQLSDKDLTEFKASKCAKGSDPACKLEKIRRSNWQLIVCKDVGDGEDTSPSADVVASNITPDNYQEYTDEKIQDECSTRFADDAAKLEKCVTAAKDKRDKLVAENGSGILNDPVAGNDCGGVQTAIIKCDADNSGDLNKNGIWALLLIVINIMTAGVGVLAVAGIVYGSILYTTAEDKADQVSKAVEIIRNVVIGLVIFALMWAGLNFIIPGGVFSA